MELGKIDKILKGKEDECDVQYKKKVAYLAAEEERTNQMVDDCKE